MPKFDVLIVNTDAQRLPICVLLGGDYRTGRRTRCSLEVTDPDGKVLPILPGWSSFGGGFCEFRVLSYRESAEVDRNMHLTSYVSIPKPGRYTVRVLFSDINIVCLGFAEGVIVYRSNPFVVDFQVPPIRRSREADEAVRELLFKLPEEGPVLILDGVYGRPAQEEIPPETPVGRILALGWQAVPEMVDQVHAPWITTGKRAWLLGLLFSVTGCNDPRSRGDFFTDPEARKCKFWWATSDDLSKAFEEYRMYRDDELTVIAARWAEWKPSLERAIAVGAGLPVAPLKPPAPAGLTVDLGGGVTMQMVPIRPGKFMMESPDSEKGRTSKEEPHEVTISKPFFLGETEVTQAQYQAVMGTNPSSYRDPKNPVESVSWDEAVEFCKKLSEKTGKSFRLPTEAEWEYACRAGTQTAFSFGDDPSALGDYAWHKGNNGWRPHPVGRKRPNAWGLYDMHGNVFEWCADWYGDYPQGPATDPSGPAFGTARVLRGGSYLFDNTDYFRCAYRASYVPAYRYNHYGFRCAVNLP